MKIVPTPGRIVWYRPTAADKIMRNGSDPLACRVAGVIPQYATKLEKRSVEKDGKTVEEEVTVTTEEVIGYLCNLAGDDFIGQPFDRQNVPLVQNGEPKPDHCYCEFPVIPSENRGGMSPSDVDNNIKTLYANFRGIGKDFEAFKKDVGDGLKEIRQRLDGIHDRMAIQSAPDGSTIRMPEQPDRFPPPSSTTADPSVDQPPKSEAPNDL